MTVAADRVSSAHFVRDPAEGGNADQGLLAPETASPEIAVTQHKVLLWHWGRAGAGAKFTYELVRELRCIPGISPAISASSGSDLAALAASLPDVPCYETRTFNGDKQTLGGKFAAATGLLGLPRIGYEFHRVVRAFAPSAVICTFQSIWDIAALPALRSPTNRFILFLHDAELHPGDWYPFRGTVLRSEIDAADGLIVLSEHVGRSAQRIYGFPSDRIWRVPHGAFAFDDNAAAPRAFPRDRPLRLLFLGRIVAYKGLGLLLDVYRLLTERGARVELEISGSGDLAPYAAQLDGLQGLSIRNTWLNEEEIAQALARSDLAVLSYIEASQSGVAAAALAAGLPIVATPVGGLIEQVRDRHTGVIAKGLQVSDLADAIQIMLDDPAIYESCSAGALDFARAELSWKPIAAKVGEIVTHIAARPRRGSCQ